MNNKLQGTKVMVQDDPWSSFDRAGISAYCCNTVDTCDAAIATSKGISNVSDLAWDNTVTTATASFYDSCVTKSDFTDLCARVDALESVKAIGKTMRKVTDWRFKRSDYKTLREREYGLCC